MDLYILISSVISILVGVLPLFFVKRDIQAFVVAAAAYFTAIIVKAVIQYFFFKLLRKPSDTYIPSLWSFNDCYRTWFRIRVRKVS